MIPSNQGTGQRPSNDSNLDANPPETGSIAKTDALSKGLGQCHVSSSWIKELAPPRRRHHFSGHAIALVLGRAAYPPCTDGGVHRPGAALGQDGLLPGRNKAASSLVPLRCRRWRGGVRARFTRTCPRLGQGRRLTRRDRHSRGMQLRRPPWKGGFGCRDESRGWLDCPSCCRLDSMLGCLLLGHRGQAPSFTTGIAKQVEKEFCTLIPPANHVTIRGQRTKHIPTEPTKAGNQLGAWTGTMACRRAHWNMWILLHPKNVRSIIHDNNFSMRPHRCRDVPHQPQEPPTISLPGFGSPAASLDQVRAVTGFTTASTSDLELASSALALGRELQKGATYRAMANMPRNTSDAIDPFEALITTNHIKIFEIKF